MFRILPLVLLFAVLFTVPAIAGGEEERQEIAAVLAAQQKAWNKGNIEEFMAGYWNHDSLSFIGRKGITYGWKNTLENYKRSYPDAATMGNLNFEILVIDVIGKKDARVVGKWQVRSAKGDSGGYFTLFFRKLDGRWVIVSDHTS